MSSSHSDDDAAVETLIINAFSKMCRGATFFEPQKEKSLVTTYIIKQRKHRKERKRYQGIDQSQGVKHLHESANCPVENVLNQVLKVLQS